MRYLILGKGVATPPFETDDINVVLDMYHKGAKIYKPVMFKTLEEIQNDCATRN
jgi:hypothetical protein